MQRLEYNMGTAVHAFTTTRRVNARRTHPIPLSALTGLPAERIVIPHQVHTSHCLCVDSAFLALSADERATRLEGIDAVITQEPDTLICISTADCIPILIYDRRHHAAAAVHAGWRGTVLRIAEKTLTMMQQRFGTRGEDCQAVIGPGISLDSFEVGDEVYDSFCTAGFDMSTIAKQYPPLHGQSRSTGILKWHIDLKECNRQQLLHGGLRPNAIHVSPICTLQDPEFFSARREGIQTGRNMSCIYLKDSK